MLRVKERFPDEATLKTFLATNAATYTEQVRAELGGLEAKYKAALRAKWWANILIVGGIIGAVTFFNVAVDISFFQNGWLFLMVLIGAGVAVWKGWGLLKTLGTTIEEFNSTLNDILFEHILSFFGLEGGRVSHTLSLNKVKIGEKPPPAALLHKLQSGGLLQALSAERQQVLQLLDHSELITEPRNRVTVDDMISVVVAERTLFVSEIDAKHVTGSGKHRRVKKIFKGYFVSFELPKTLEGKTFVTTEGDKTGFGNQSFLSGLKKSHPQVTLFEWNEFESKLHVVTDNNVEARYILTPDFMHDLYDWWVDKKQNIRISFVANRMYILFPDEKLRLGSTIKEITTEQIRSYLEIIALPLLHVLHLIEDVEKRF